MIKAILACDDLGGIALNGEMPWPKNTKDLQWFKQNTDEGVVVMGSSTWNSKGMPKPLPNRTNVVATNQNPDDFDCDGILKGDLKLAVLRMGDMTTEGTDIWIIGGANIIEQTLPIIEEFYISRIPGDYKCDTHLPLDKIEQQFELSYSDKQPEVTFEIWKKRV